MRASDDIFALTFHFSDFAHGKRADTGPQRIAAAVDDFERMMPAAFEYVDLIPGESRRDIVHPAQVARQGREVVSCLDEFRAASENSPGAYFGLRRVLLEFRDWIRNVTEQMGANLEALWVLGEQGHIPTALERGDEIWRWSAGNGTHVGAAAEVFQRGVDHAASAAAASASGSLDATCTALARDLDTARAKAQDLHAALEALTE